jgi:uncharacterized membrane protein YfcA
MTWGRIGDSVQQMRDNFEAQFEAAGENRYVYRLNQKREPIPVTAEERDRFIRQYVRRIWFVLSGMVGVLLAFLGLIIWRTFATNSELSDVQLYIGIGVISVVAICLMYWVRGAPARELEGRTPVGRERSTDEMRAIFFRKISYGQLAGVAGFGVIFPFMLAFGRSPIDVFHGWGRLWFVLSAAFVLLAAVQAFRKWRFELDHPNDVI